jgi:nucleoid DNA-binding protein
LGDLCGKSLCAGDAVFDGENQKKLLKKWLDQVAQTRKSWIFQGNWRCLVDNTLRNSLVSKQFRAAPPLFSGVSSMAKAAAKPAAKKAAPAKKALTKSQFVSHLAEKATITKKQVEAVLDEIIEVIKTQVSTKGPGKFVFPNLCKVSVTRKPAVKGGEKKINRLTGAEYETKDKPAYNQVKLRPVKALKDALK